MPDPGQQALFVGMAADSGETGNLRLDLDGFSEELNRLGSFENLASEAADRLIADKEDRALPAPEVVFEMVLNPARVTHAAGRKNYLRCV